MWTWYPTEVSAKVLSLENSETRLLLKILWGTTSNQKRTGVPYTGVYPTDAESKRRARRMALSRNQKSKNRLFLFCKKNIFFLQILTPFFEKILDAVLLPKQAQILPLFFSKRNVPNEF